MQKLALQCLESGFLYELKKFFSICKHSVNVYVAQSFTAVNRILFPTGDIVKAHIQLAFITEKYIVESCKSLAVVTI